MLKLMKQAKAAFSLLSADEIAKQASMPVHVGLVADGSGAYAEMEELLVPPRCRVRNGVSGCCRCSIRR